MKIVYSLSIDDQECLYSDLRHEHKDYIKFILEYIKTHNHARNENLIYFFKILLDFEKIYDQMSILNSI